MIDGFTPGPWTVSGAGTIYRATTREGLFIDDANGNTICDLYFDTGTHLHQFENPEANARLIAAAPRLYSFVASKADSGDTEALQLIKDIDDANP